MPDFEKIALKRCLALRTESQQDLSIVDPEIIEKEALQLPDTQRAVLADRLLESLSQAPTPLRESWVREIHDRKRAFAAGDIEAIDGPTAMESLKSRFRR